jgi:hypothetical protein
MDADRIHDSLEKDTPAMRPISSRPDQAARLISLQRIAGLHHRYYQNVKNSAERAHGWQGNLMAPQQKRKQ